MVDGSGVSPTASLMELSMQLHGGSCVDSFKAVVLVLPQWWEDVLREIYWSWKDVGSPWTVGWSWKGVSTLESILLRWVQPSAGVHQARRASSPSQSWEDVSGETLRPGRVGVPWSRLIQHRHEQLLGYSWVRCLVNTKV